MWREIPGYYYRYRINDEGEVQRYWEDKREWRTKKAHRSGGKYYSGYRLMVKLTVKPKVYKEVPVVDLMVNAFMGGRAAHPGKIVSHRNGMLNDCSLQNLIWITRKELGKRSGGSGRKSVVKIDKDGNEVAIYRSTLECCAKEYIHRKTLWRMIKNKTPATKSCTGYAYRYEK